MNFYSKGRQQAHQSKLQEQQRKIEKSIQESRQRLVSLRIRKVQSAKKRILQITQEKSKKITSRNLSQERIKEQTKIPIPNKFVQAIPGPSKIPKPPQNLWKKGDLIDSLDLSTTNLEKYQKDLEKQPWEDIRASIEEWAPRVKPQILEKPKKRSKFVSKIKEIASEDYLDIELGCVAEEEDKLEASIEKLDRMKIEADFRRDILEIEEQTRLLRDSLDMEEFESEKEFEGEKVKFLEDEDAVLQDSIEIETVEPEVEEKSVDEMGSVRTTMSRKDIRSNHCKYRERKKVVEKEDRVSINPNIDIRSLFSD